MKYAELNALFVTDFNINNIIAIEQEWEKGKGFSYLETPRPDHGLFLLTDTDASYELPDGMGFNAKAGAILFLPQGSHYAVTFHPKQSCGHPMLVNFRITDALGNEPRLQPGILQLGKDVGAYLPVFTAIVQLYKTANLPRLKSKVYQLIGNLFPIAQQDECCISYINNHYTDNFKIPELAKRCGMCETAYRKRFRQLTGCSPIQYITSVKIEKACQMLRSSQIGIQEISDFLNFYSAPYFYKIFKEQTGMTPAEFRNNP